jgi:glucosyl-dolichyl phosphate glucuronosyltransferase
MFNITLSIVVCTHNRADLARDAITSVLEQDFPKDEYELLIVDNASTDHTREMAREFCDAYPNVRYILETNIGLSYARNRGWQEAHGEYVGYLDDDAKALSKWLVVAKEVIYTVRPAVFGGPILPMYHSPKPAWYKDEYATVILLSAPGILDKEFISGGNSFNRMDVLKALNGFHPSFGMNGERQGYGEETEMQIRLRGEFPNEILYYHPKLAIRHLVPAHKMEISYILKRRFQGARAFVRAQVGKTHPMHKNLRIVLEILLILLKLVKDSFAMLFRDKSEYPYWQNYIFEQIAVTISQLGIWIEMASLKYKKIIGLL